MANKRKELNIKGANLWYLVGLITSDGCLSKDGRHINITSKEYSFLNEIKNSFGLTNKIGVKNKKRVNKAYQIQFSNVELYDFLLSIGLSPNKSLILGQIKLPEIYFSDFLRGLIDGDGGIQRWVHRTNKTEQWNLRISSGSKQFLEWLKDEIEKIIQVKGRFYSQAKNQFRLKYGKMAARIMLKKCYYEGCFGLQRKIILAKNCMDSYKGWSRSRTINS